jgi:hypothetical protein
VNSSCQVILLIVQVSAGQEPYVRRGCGLFKCGLLPAGSQGDACDDNLEVTPPITGLVNQSRVFNSGDGHGPVAVLQYCRVGKLVLEPRTMI